MSFSPVDSRLFFLEHVSRLYRSRTDLSMSDTGLASLKSQCDTLKTNITRTSTSLRDFVSYYTDGQDAVAAVAGELSDLQAAADKIVDEPLDDVSVPASLATAANMLVGVCIESVNQLDSVLLSPQRSRSRHGDWLQDVAKQAAAMGKTLVPCSSGLHLAADSLVMLVLPCLKHIRLYLGHLVE